MIEIGNGTDYVDILQSMYSCVLRYKWITDDRGYCYCALGCSEQLTELNGIILCMDETLFHVGEI